MDDCLKGELENCGRKVLKRLNERVIFSSGKEIITIIRLADSCLYIGAGFMKYVLSVEN